MNIKNIVLTMVGISAIYKAGKFMGIAQTHEAVDNELRKNHNMKVEHVHWYTWPKHKLDVKVVKNEEEEAE